MVILKKIIRKGLVLGIVLLFTSNLVEGLLLDRSILSNNRQRGDENSYFFENDAFLDGYSHEPFLTIRNKNNRSVQTHYLSLHNRSGALVSNLTQLFTKGNNRSIINVPGDYPTIQSAIDHASPGDEIQVSDGTYIENIIVDKPVWIHSICGYENCTISINNSDYPAIKIISDNVTISGFKIYKHAGKYGILLDSCRDCMIDNNYLSQFTYQIYINNCINISIFNNLLGYWGAVEYDGIYAYYSSQLLIFNNDWRTHLWEGINFYKVTNSTLVNNSFVGNYAVALDHCDSLDFYDNIFYDCFWAHFASNKCNNLRICNNTFFDSQNDGLYFQYCSNFYIENNTFIGTGIFNYYSYGNHIKNNTVNGRQLVYLENVSNYRVDEVAGQIIALNCCNISSSSFQNLSDSVVGIELIHCIECNFSNCLIVFNDWEGIYIVESTHINFFNVDNRGAWIGLNLRNLNNISYEHGICHGYQYPIYCENCECMSFQHNEVYGGLDGTRLIKSKEIIFSYNYIKQSDYNLLLLSDCHNGFVQNNVFHSDNDYGLRISLSSFNNISNNTFSSNALNLILGSSHNNSFYNNTFGSSPISSVWFEASNDNVFSHNIINNEIKTGTGFEFRYCSRCTIIKNDFLKGSVSFRYNIFNYNFGNKWENNYWFKPILHPKIIKGRLTFGCPNYPIVTLPWVQFDRNPVSVPNFSE